MIFVDFVVLRENFWFLPPKIRSRRHVGAGWFLTTALVGMLLSQNSFSILAYRQLGELSALIMRASEILCLRDNWSP